MNGLFVEYINTFLKMKQQASGKPTDCIDEQSHRQCIREYAERENVYIEESKVEENPGLRSRSKLCLNLFFVIVRVKYILYALLCRRKAVTLRLL